MKKLGLILIALVGSHIGLAQNSMEALKNSMERKEGGSGVEVEYFVHQSPSSLKSYYAKNFDTGVLVELNGKPIYYELVSKKGEEQNSVVINIERTTIIEFEIYYVKGNCHYKFDFYY